MNMNKEERKRIVEEDAKMVAMAIIESGDNFVISLEKENAPEKIMIGCEKCLLSKYNIRMLRVEGYDDVRIFILASLSENKQKRIMKFVQEEIPKIKEEQKMIEELQNEAYECMAENFLKWLAGIDDDHDDYDENHDEECDEQDNMMAN